MSNVINDTSEELHAAHCRHIGMIQIKRTYIRKKDKTKQR